MKGTVLFIQLTRIGDLVQTLQAVRQFKGETPGIECHLIARKSMGKGIDFLLRTVFEKIFYLDTKDLLIEGTFASGHRNLKHFINRINETTYDVSVNFSYTKSSSYLHSLVRSNQKLGLTRNDKTEVSVTDPWSQYVYSSVMRGTNTPFNLVDIYRYSLGCKELLVLQNESEETRENRIVIHPFASSKKKSWGATKWVEVIYKLLNEYTNYDIHLVGAPNDLEEVSKIVNSPALEKVKTRLKSHVGDFAIEETYALLQRAKLFIGHDSLVSHLAAETLTQSIVISLGTVRPHETTAYSDKVINLVPRNSCFPCKVDDRCELLPCHNSIQHQVVTKVAESYLSDGLKDINTCLAELSPFHTGNLKIYKSEYTETGLRLNELTKNYSDIKDVFKNYYEIIFQYYLRGTDINTSLPDITVETANNLSQYIEGTNHLFELYNFGVRYCNQIIKASEQKQVDYAELQAAVKKLNEVDQLCQITKQTYPLLADLIDFFHVNKANTPGNNLNEIAKSSLLCFYDASNLAAVINDFIKNTVESKINVAESIKEV